MLPGVGTTTERMIWEQGVASWNKLINIDALRGISRRRLSTLQEIAADISARLEGGCKMDLMPLIPRAEQWRFLGEWNSVYAALDVECVSAGRDRTPVMISIQKGFSECTTLVRGDDLCWRSFSDALRGARIVITFNGSSFDLPILKEHGYRLPSRAVHIDLRRFCRRAGLYGGLKDIERTLGIGRRRELEFSTEEQVAYLWRIWERLGRCNALSLLQEYNQQDVKSLVLLSRYLYDRLSRDARRETCQT